MTHTTAAGAGDRNPAWAEPVHLPPAENLFRVTPDIYRSAQPSTKAMARLEEALGIKTIINLRNFHDDTKEARGTGLILERLPMNTWNINEDELLRVLAMIREAQKPVLIHCQHGADRTGLVMAMYRMVEQGWPPEAALDEMVNGGYGFHAIWAHIPRMVKEADTATLRARLDGKTPRPPEEPVVPDPPGASE